MVSVWDEAVGFFNSTVMRPNIEMTPLRRHTMSHLAFFSRPWLCRCSMDVQGDYDPCDASGFIRINAVRSDSQSVSLFFILGVGGFQLKQFYQ